MTEVLVVVYTLSPNVASVHLGFAPEPSNSIADVTPPAAPLSEKLPRFNRNRGTTGGRRQVRLVPILSAQSLTSLSSCAGYAVHRKCGKDVG